MRTLQLTSTLCGPSGPLFFIGLWDESLRLIERAYEMMDTWDAWYDVGACAYDAAWVYFNRANTDEAALWLERCVHSWERAGGKREQAAYMRMSGLIARQQKDYDAASQLFREALAIWRVSGSDEDVATGFYSLGKLEIEQVHYDVAEQYLHEARTLMEKVGSKDGLAVVSCSLGVLEFKRERWAEAREQYEKALPLAREVRRQDCIADAQRGLARVGEAEGRPDLALPLAQEALAIEEKLRSKHLPETRNLVERLKKKIGNQGPQAQ